MPADGTGRNGVLVVLEAAGADEEVAGLPTVGKAGYYLWQTLKRCGLERDDFRIHNVLSCRPPNNKLSGEWYEDLAIQHCAPNLDATIHTHITESHQRGLQPVILALGSIAFKRVMGLKTGDSLLKEDYHGYVHETPLYPGTYIIAAFHPAYLMRGQHQYVPTLQFAAQRAVDVARGGFAYHQPHYLCDPAGIKFGEWVADYFHTLERFPTSTYLSFDIETPMKAKRGEDKMVREDDEDYIILRCAFAFRPGEAVSVPWSAEYFAILEQLFADPRNQLVTWNGNYDIPRVKHQLSIGGVNHDAMLAWHVLNSALDKSLGFVTPYYAKDARMWKHLAGSTPAAYNAQDADMALRNYLGIRDDLGRVNQLAVFERHVVELNKILDRMSAAGLKRDEVMRQEAEDHLTRLLTETEAEIQAAVPEEARKLHVYKGKPRNMDGVKARSVVKEMKRCQACGMIKPTKAHTQIFKKKVNPCGGAEVLTGLGEVVEYYREIEWKPSTVQLVAYQKALKQQAIRNRDGNATFDEDATEKLMRKYPADPLYPLLLDHRKYQKLRGVCIGITQEDGSIQGGLRVGKDGLIHCEYTHNPSTLRLACQNPNMTNLPRTSKVKPGEAEPLENVVRNLIVAREGHILLEADFAAIEAVLSAYFARWKDGIRLAKLGVHSYLASHVLERPADLSWSDADLKEYFAEIKGSKDPRVNQVYNGCKRAIHLSNYGGTPRKMVQAEPDTFPDVKYATRLQEMYFDVAKPIRTWQLQAQMEAHQNGFLRNPFGYIHRFTHVFRNEKVDGQWVRKPGDQANAVLAFLPQSTAAGIIKEVMLRLAQDPVVGPCLRLQVHDSLVLEVLLKLLNDVRAVLIDEMCKPVEQLPLPASFGMGPALSIGVDHKEGLRWGSLK